MDIIKKYRNRKLYSMNKNAYINLEQLLEIAKGEQVRVLSPDDKNITEQVLLQAIRKVYKRDLMGVRDQPTELVYSDTSELFRLLRGL